jgi:hypothetical protein
MTFAERVRAGLVPNPDDAVNDDIDAWHEAPETNTLHGHLGFTWDEYAAFLTDANVRRVLGVCYTPQLAWHSHIVNRDEHYDGDDYYSASVDGASLGASEMPNGDGTFKAYARVNGVRTLIGERLPSLDAAKIAAEEWWKRQ